MLTGSGKCERPTVKQPQATDLKGKDEAIKSTNATKTDNTTVNIKQTKDLDKIKENETSRVTPQLNVLYRTESEYETTDDELPTIISLDTTVTNETNSENVSSFASLRTITAMTIDEDRKRNTEDKQVKHVNITTYRTWKPPCLQTHTAHHTANRRIYSGNDNIQEPNYATRIPVRISIFGEIIKGIIDSGSDRSFLSTSAYERVKNFQLKNLEPDNSTHKGVRLGNKTVVKTKGGTGFIIDIGDVYGPQWFSILPGLSGDLILGMDFWMSFKVTVDPFTRTWTLPDSKYRYQLSNTVIIDSELRVLTVDQTQKLRAFLDEEFNKFAKESTGMTELMEHIIELDDPTPHRQTPYRRSEIIRNFIKDEVNRLLEKGYVTWSNSEWACSPVVAPKANGGLRFCINYKPLNRQTKKPAYPLHNMRSILSQLHQAKIISTLDMSEAFHQIPMQKESQKYTAFVVEGVGQLEWLRMPYGLTGAPSTFQRLMDKLKRQLKDLIHERQLPNKWVDQVFTYLDDWIIVSQNLEEHISILSLVFEVFRKANLIVNREKSSFACKEVKFLGYIVDEQGMRPNPEKIQPILDFPVPKDRTQLRQFNGLVNWYHRHLKNIAKVQGPLNKLTSVKVPWQWTDVEQKSFEEIKRALTNAPRLYVPIPGQPFVLYTDASDFGLGAILVQLDPESSKENLIEILSRPLRGAELHYTTTEKECLAVVWSVEKLRCYLEGMPFKIVTDHQALQWLHSLKNPTGRLARWAMYLYQHDITVEHRRGTTNEAPDALSRIFDLDEDFYGWENIIEKTKQNCPQLNSIRDQDWYQTKYKLVRTQPDRFPEWKIENDELFYYRPDFEKALIDDENPWKKVVKSDDILTIIHDNHDAPEAGHLGKDKTIDRVRRDYYWPGMTLDIKSYIENCEICTKVKYNQNPIKGPLMTRPLQQPWAQLSIDTVVSQTR